MKKIIKKTEQPQVLADWKRRNPGRKYKDFQRTSEKRLLHKELLEDQFFLCCYCGINIGVNNSHIEHIKPQSQFNDLTLSYSNMLISCNGENVIESDEYELKYCGHQKLNQYDLEMLTPLEEDCEERMILTAVGKLSLVQNIDYGAKKAIDILGLNSYVLITARFSIIDIYIEEAMQKSADEEIEYYKEELEYLQTVIDGKLPNFSQELSTYLINELSIVL